MTHLSNSTLSHTCTAVSCPLFFSLFLSSRQASPCKTSLRSGTAACVSRSRRENKGICLTHLVFFGH